MKFRVRCGLAHLAISGLIAVALAFVVLVVWYPKPYDTLSGGLHLFLLVIFVDVSLGPLITTIIANPQKSRRLLRIEIAFVAALQLAALFYGVYAVYVARPLFLVLEVDRFKVIGRPQLEDGALDHLDRSIAPSLFRGPRIVALRRPSSEDEKLAITLEAANGGRDFGERPEFYVPYSEAAAHSALKRAKPLADFAKGDSARNAAIAKFVASSGVAVDKLFYLPVIARKDWIAVINADGLVQGFLEGDGFM